MKGTTLSTITIEATPVPAPEIRLQRNDENAIQTEAFSSALSATVAPVWCIWGCRNQALQPCFARLAAITLRGRVHFRRAERAHPARGGKLKRRADGNAVPREIGFNLACNIRRRP
jgi:hypothetical protein